MDRSQKIETKRLVMRPLGLSFLSNTYLNWMQDEEVVKFMDSGGKNYSFNDLKEYLLEIDEKNIYSWAIILKDRNYHIGNIKIDPIDSKKSTGEYGIMIGDKSSWGKGYAREASLGIINFCFNDLLLRKINLGVVSNNENALSLYKSLGFVEEKRIKKQNPSNDSYYEIIRMTLLNN